MSKQVIVICRGQSLGCPEKRVIIVANDDLPDIIRGEWMCPECEKRLEYLQAEKEVRLRAQQAKEQEKLDNPGKCLSCAIKLQRNRYCQPCLRKRIKERFRESQEASAKLNEQLLKNEESNNQLKEALLDWLANLEKRNKDDSEKSAETVERELKESNKEIARIKKQIAENENNKTLSTQPNSSPPIQKPNQQSNNENNKTLSTQPNSSPPIQKPNPQSNINCCVCKKNFNYGENTNYFSQRPDKKWCNSCQPRVDLNTQAMQQIIAGQVVNVDSLNVPEEDKHVLRATQRVVRGDDVDIDNLLGIDDEDKEVLKELQRQRKDQVQQPPKEKQEPFYRHKYFSWIVGLTGVLVLGIPYSIYRAKKAKKMGKKYNWWIDKIS